MTWTRADLIQLLREESGGACDHFEPDYNDECLHCDQGFLRHRCSSYFLVKK